MARPFRYTLILATVAFGTALAAVGGWRYARASAPLSGPVILISIDSLRADHLPAYGYAGVKTPAIDQLAADGVVFERAYSHVPQTLPAHTAILSGRLPFETGVRDDEQTMVRTGERLLPRMLQERGYSTAGIVSSALLRRETGIGQGFDFFDAGLPARSADVSMADLRRDGSESELAAERWLGTVGTARAFLFLHLNELAAPLAPPERFSTYSAYDGAIAYSDEIVGRLVHYLKSHQMYDRSTVILLSDHGEGLGDHGEQGHGLLVYREALHVPLIVKQESNAGAGRRVKDLAQHVDLVPTVLDLVKAPAPGNLRGVSLKPLLDGAGHLPDRAVYSESRYARSHFGWGPMTSITNGRYQYVTSPTDALYDLSKDPGEQRNIAAADPKALEAMRKALSNVLSDGGKAAKGDGTPAPDVPLDTQLRVVEPYRKALELAGVRKWSESLAVLQGIVRHEPDLVEVWSRLAAVASRIDRFDVAVDAYKHVIRLESAGPWGYIGIAGVLMKQRKLDDAKAQADRAVDLIGPRDARARATVHELLARIALASHDPDEAVAEAGRAQQAEPKWPVQAVVNARAAYDRGEYEEALPLFEQALKALNKAGGPEIPELHFYAAETFTRLERTAEAEAEYLEEIRAFPQNARAHAGLAGLYQATGRTDEAADVVREMTVVAPTPEGYALAARLWKTLGKPRLAEAVRFEARKALRRNSELETKN